MTVPTALARFSFVSLVAIVGHAQAPTPYSTGAHGGFALRDEAGSRSIMLTHHDGKGVDSLDQAKPELLKTALCSGGRKLSVAFDQRQTAGARSDFREMPYMFDKLEGSVFTVTGGKAGLEAGCFLATEALLAGNLLLTTSAPSEPGVCATPGRFTASRSRPVAHCWPIALAAGGQ